MTRVVPIALLAAGCIEPGTVTVAAPDEASYRAHVHPVVEFGCATLDCHGDPGRPLRIFSSTGLRAGDARDAPLSEAEYAEDVRSFAALAPAPLPADLHPALTKPVAGGASHEGGDIWASPGEDGYACLRGWLANEMSAGVEAACAAAFDAYGIPPETP